MKPAILVFLSLSLAQAQTFDQWFLDTLRQQVAKNGSGAERQRESPSADARSTSLVDQSSATDFISLAMNVIPVAPSITRLLPPGTPGVATSGGAQSTGSGTATASLYALMAAFNKVKPTDPQFYRTHVGARRVSFTIGTAASTIEEHNSDKPATVVGAKFLIINKRELYTTTNQSLINAVQNGVSNYAVAEVRAKDRVQQLIFEALHPEGVNADGSLDPVQFATFVSTAFSASQFPATLRSLSGEAVARIEAYLRSVSGPFVTLRTLLNNTYDSIQKAGQFSVAYAANVRQELGTNTHRAQLIYDYGLSDRILWVVNASGDYSDRKVGIDTRGGRVATEFLGDITRAAPAFGRLPMRLAFSGEAKWMTKQKPQYTFQTKLSLPVAPGVDIPVVYRYANRIDLIDQTSSEARLGLSFDLMRLAAALR